MGQLGEDGRYSIEVDSKVPFLVLSVRTGAIDFIFFGVTLSKDEPFLQPQCDLKSALHYLALNSIDEN